MAKISDAERKSYIHFINKALASEDQASLSLPLDPDAENQLFEACKTGILFG